MKVSEVIEELQKYNPDLDVKVFNDSNSIMDFGLVEIIKVIDDTEEDGEPDCVTLII